jgi:hypothetical protein
MQLLTLAALRVEYTADACTLGLSAFESVAAREFYTQMDIKRQRGSVHHTIKPNAIYCA